MNLPKHVKQLIKSKKFRKTIIEEYQKYWQEQMDYFFFGPVPQNQKKERSNNEKTKNNGQLRRKLHPQP